MLDFAVCSCYNLNVRRLTYFSPDIRIFLMKNQDSTFINIKRKSIVDDILESIKQGLIKGDLTPGQRIPSENALAQKFGVGRPAIRESMKMLSALGIVEIKQGNGTYIATDPSAILMEPLSFALLLQSGMTNELLELRYMMEIAYCQLAAQKATNEDLLNIENAVDAWTEYARDPERDMDQLVQMDLNFHDSIINATHNPYVIRICKAVNELYYASIRTTISDYQRLMLAIENHHKIVSALHTRDPETIRVKILESLANWEKVVKESNGKGIRQA